MSHPLDAALSGGDATNANGPTAVKTYADVVASTVVATAQINNTLFIYPLIQLVVNNKSAGWSNVAPGMDVLIGTTAGASDIGIYRVKSADSTFLYIGEAGPGDSGLLTVGIRTASFAVGQYITVLTRYSIYSVLPLITSNSTIWEDYNVLVSDGPANWNGHPPPLVQVKCTSTSRTEYNHIACFVDAGQSYATITFLASVTLWPTSASATYAWTAPGSWTVTGGATNTATFTAQVPSAAANYVLELAVTEDGGNIAKRHVMVWVHDRSGSKAPLTVSGLSGDGWDRTGARLTFTLNNNLLASYPDGAMVCLWQEATFNGATIATAVDQFVGWFTRLGKRAEPGLRTADPEFVGPAGILEFKRGTSQIFDVTASTPANWQQLPASLMSLSFAQFWLLSQRARNVLELFDCMLYSNDATGQRLPELNIPPGQLWSQLVSLAQGISMRNIGCDPDGTIWVQPHPSLIDYSSRSSIVKRDTLTASIYHAVDWPRELFDKVGLVEGEAFTWDGTAALPTPLLSLALSTSLGQGGNDVKLQNQVVASQSELNTLTGHYYRLLNPDYPDITVSLQSNRGALYKPAQMPMVRLQIPATLTPEGVAFDRYVIPREVRRTYTTTELGSTVVDSQLIAEVETAGVAGTTKSVPAANNNLYTETVIYTPPATQSSTWGVEDTSFLPAQLIALMLGGYVYTLSGFPSSPSWTDISPSSAQRAAVNSDYTAYPVGKLIADPFNFKRYIAQFKDGFLICDDVSAATPTWRTVTGFLPSGYFMVDDSTGGTARQWFSDSLEGSINRQGYFGWICRDHQGANIQYQYTTDSFTTIHTVDLGAIGYVSGAHAGDGVTIHLFNSGSSSTGYVWVSGTTIYESSDWGASFSAKGSPFNANTNDYVGYVVEPFQIAGVNNTARTLFWLKGNDATPNYNVIGLDGAAHTAPLNTPYTWGSLGRGTRGTNIYTLDGNKINFVSQINVTLDRSSDGGATWDQVAIGSMGGTPYHIGLNGWPTNPNFLLAFSNTGLAYTNDRGASWTSITLPFGMNPVDVQALLYLNYPSGGVHS